MMSSKLLVSQLWQYGERVLQCPVYLTRGIHEADNQRVLRCTCALLNSGGGILHMHNVQHAGKVQSKDLDTWWSGMESNMADILSGDDLCNYFDFVGSFDDEDLLLFVKTAEHLCTLRYHCRLPTDTATHSVTYLSASKLLGKDGVPSPLGDLPAVPSEFKYGEIIDSLKQEGKQIQFKFLSTGKDQAKSFADRVRQYCVKYVSAFANHYGGHVYFGIEDTSAAVYGEALEANMEKRITHQVERMMCDVIWGDTRVKAERGKHWEVHFYPVSHCPRNERRRVVVVSVCKFPGGVFTSCPESYVLAPDDAVQQLTFEEWKQEILSLSRSRPDLQSRFVKVPLHTPFSRLVYTLPHTLQAAKERVLNLSTGCNLQPKQYLETLSDPQLVTGIRRVVSTFRDEPHLVLPLQCWSTRLDVPGHEDLLSALFIVSRHYGLHLAMFVTSLLNSAEVWGVGRAMARQLKRRLVRHGGCSHHLAVRIHLLSLADPLLLENFQASLDSTPYPPTFQLSPQKLDDIVTSLVIAIASYSPCQQPPSLSPPPSSSSPPCHFLLTCDQLQLLWTRQFTKELWVHGPPGAGKTVAALEMARELVERGCLKEQVLYLAENPLLCAYVSSFDLCMVASRRELMEDSVCARKFSLKYLQVRNVLVDEAQNFKDRDGDWYALAQRLANQTSQSPVVPSQEGPSLQVNVCQSVTKMGQCPDVSSTITQEIRSQLESKQDCVQSVPILISGDDESTNARKTSGLDASSKMRDLSDGESTCAHKTFEDASSKTLDSMDAESIPADNTEQDTMSKSSNSRDASTPLPSNQQLNPVTTNHPEDAAASASKKSRSSSTEPELTRGYFWVFMDYAQKVHKFRAGLPGLIGKNNFMLSEISRNSKEIFDYAMRFMSKPGSGGIESVNNSAGGGFSDSPAGECLRDRPVLGHDYQNGRGVEVVRCDKQAVQRTLFTVLESYLGSGVKADDIAILVSKRQDKEQLQASVKQEADRDGPGGVNPSVTIDTVRGFSGLDKPVVIGLEPHTNQQHASLDKLIVNLATRAKDGLVIITTSDELMKKLQSQ